MVAKGFDVTHAQQESVARRVVLAVSRFGRGVERVKVRLSSVANLLGGVDTRCEMRAWLRPRGSVAVETVDGSTAIDRAAARLAARVEWALVDGHAEASPSLYAPAAPWSGATLYRGHRRRPVAAAGRGGCRT